MGVALEGEHVGRHPVEEPTVVRDHQHRPGEGEDRLLEGAQGVDIEIVGRLVEHEDVGALLEHLRQVDAVALAARELFDRFLLIRTGEVEAADIGA